MSLKISETQGVGVENEWSLREQILRTAHQWPYPLMACILGALLALGISFLIPVRYVAESRLSVSYFSDAIFRNSDDYKNWEIGQLNTFIFTEPVLEATLDKLKNSEPYWERFSTQDLLPTLHVYWRNTGTWRLVAKADTPRHATQLVQAWKQAVLESLEPVLIAANKLTEISYQLNAIARSQVELTLRATELAQIKNRLSAWRSDALHQNLDQGIDRLQSWQLQILIAQITPSNPAGLKLLKTTPAMDAPGRDYIDWVEQALVLIDEQYAIVQAQIPILDSQHNEYFQQWQAAYQISDGLSAYIHIESIPDLNSAAHAERSSSLAALVGGILGILSWVFYWLMRPFLRAAK
jgi:hypothetical protein